MVEATRDNHSVLFGNVAALRQAMHDCAQDSLQHNEERAAQAYLFWADQLADVQRGASLGELFADLEFVYRQATAMAVQARRGDEAQVSLASVHVAHMVARALRPDLGEDEIQDQVLESLARRDEELDEE